MDREKLEAILVSVQQGHLPVEKALQLLRDLPYEDVGFAKIDHHRPLRTGLPEVIYCPGKTAEQVAAIAAKMLEKNSLVLATRAGPEIPEALRTLGQPVTYHQVARVVVIGEGPPAREADRVTVVTAGTADQQVAEEAAVTAEALGLMVDRLYDVGVSGIHRLLHGLEKMAGASAVIAVAGMEGALPSVVAGLIEAPVIAVPTSIGYGASLGGVAALLAMLNSCAGGIAVVNIDNGFGAACLAARIARSGRRQSP